MKLKQLLPYFLAIFLMLAGWQIIALAIGYSDIFPTIDRLFVQIFLLLGEKTFYNALFFTIIRAFVGFLLALIMAFISGSLSAFNVFWLRFFMPTVVVFRSVPVIAVVLVALLWFSPNTIPVFIAFLTMFPIIHQSVLSGLKSVDNKLVEMARVFGFKVHQIYLAIYLPQAKSIILSGFSTAAGFGWRAVIIGEVLAQPIHGIGTGMKMSQVYINVPELFAWTIMAIVTSYVFDMLIRRLAVHRIPVMKRKAHRAEIRTSRPKQVSFNSVSKSFGDNVVIDDFNYDFESGKVYLLKQPSGAGKTTLLRMLAGLLKPENGQIHKDNTLRIAYSFQDLRLCNWLTVWENIEVVVPDTNPSDKELINSILSELELDALKNMYPSQLSGGQQQRVALARTLAARADVILLDEPLNGLDTELKQKVIRVINSYILKWQPIVVWATHEDFELENVPVSFPEISVQRNSEV